MWVVQAAAIGYHSDEVIAMKKHSRHSEGVWLDIVCSISLWLAVGSLVAAAAVIHINRPYIIIMLALAFCAIGETVAVFKNWWLARMIWISRVSSWHASVFIFRDECSISLFRLSKDMHGNFDLKIKSDTKKWPRKVQIPRPFS